MAELNIYQRILSIQKELKAPKNQYNKFGGYNFRNLEDINEAAKPLLHKHGVSLMISDEIVKIESRYYVQATVVAINVDDPNDSIQTQAYAREEENKKGMDGSQITGTASSYARKYAMNGLFLIDDTKDNDSNEHQQEVQNTPNNKVQPRYNPNKQPDNADFIKTRNKYYTEIHNLTNMSSEDITSYLKQKLGAHDLTNYDHQKQIGGLLEILNEAKQFASQKKG